MAAGAVLLPGAAGDGAGVAWLAGWTVLLVQPARLAMVTAATRTVSRVNAAIGIIFFSQMATIRHHHF